MMDRQTDVPPSLRGYCRTCKWWTLDSTVLNKEKIGSPPSSEWQACLIASGYALPSAQDESLIVADAPDDWGLVVWTKASFSCIYQETSSHDDV